MDSKMYLVMNSVTIVWWKLKVVSSFQPRCKQPNFVWNIYFNGFQVLQFHW